MGRTCGRTVLAILWALRSKDQPANYQSMASANGKRISNSVYLGNINGEMETEEEKQEKKKYDALKARFDQVSADYLWMQQLDRGLHTRTKAFRTLEKEYQVLKNRLDRLPGNLAKT